MRATLSIAQILPSNGACSLRLLAISMLIAPILPSDEMRSQFLFRLPEIRERERAHISHIHQKEKIRK